MNNTSVSIIIPVLDEAAGLESLLMMLPHGVEVIVVDGGSADDSVDIANKHAHKVLECGRGRARQMNAGAQVANGEVLLFLHADTRLPTAFEDEMSRFLQSGRQWGRFDVQLDAPGYLFRMIEFMMNGRSRLTGICTGDQAMFVKRSAFTQVGRFPELPLMEDITLSKGLKGISRPYCARTRVKTSARRWETGGVFRTIWLMWSLRLRYFLGASAESLAKKYYPPKSPSK